MSDGPARVLEVLRRAGGQPRSGEALSVQYGISRAQVWKFVEVLRGRGYRIDAQPGGGYQLKEVPDCLYPEEIREGLHTCWLAQELHYFETIDSTNRFALELARAGCPHGTTVVAEMQSAGRGRLGRSFHSPPGLNLYTSIVLRPRIPTSEAPNWILAAAVGVAETVAHHLERPEEVEIKWPNDVLLSGRKTSGILMELGAEATRIDFLVLGIGVNLNVDPGDFPVEFRDRATSLAAHRGKRVDRIAFAQRLYATLEEIFDLCAERGFEAVRSRFEARFAMRGRPVRVVELDGSERSGTAVGIDADGALRIRQEDGREARVIAGDVSMARGGP